MVEYLVDAEIAVVDQGRNQLILLAQWEQIKEERKVFLNAIIFDWIYENKQFGRKTFQAKLH